MISVNWPWESRIFVCIAGLGAGVTEAVMVVCPMEVVKIRLQAQMHSMSDPLDVPKYRNAAHALYLILREEGPATLYRGVALTALRQATNQGSSFAFLSLTLLYHKDWFVRSFVSCQLYRLHWIEEIAAKMATSISWWWITCLANFNDRSNLWCYGTFHQRSYRYHQVSSIYLFSSFFDIKAYGERTYFSRTRIQRATALKGETAWTRFTTVSSQMFREEGPSAFYKGITPRVARVAPGQAVVFTVYERIKTFVSTHSPLLPLERFVYWLPRGNAIARARIDRETWSCRSRVQRIMISSLD